MKGQHDTTPLGSYKQVAEVETSLTYSINLDLKNKTVQFQEPLGSYTSSLLPKALISLITSRLKSTMTEWKLIVHCHCKEMNMTAEYLSVRYAVLTHVKGMHLQQFYAVYVPK